MEFTSDLESVGYSVQPVLIPACAVGAPHRRDRVFIIAHNVADSSDYGDMRDTRANEANEEPTQDTLRHGLRCGQESEQGSERNKRNFSARDSQRICGEERLDFTDTASNRRREIHEHIQSEFSEWEEFISNGWLRYATDTGGEGLARENESRSGQEREWMRIRRDLAGYYRKTALRPQEKWSAFPTVSAVHRRNDGIPFDVDSLTILFGKWRTESLKAYGNAIVPQVMYRIFEAIEAAEKI